MKEKAETAGGWEDRSCYLWRYQLERWGYLYVVGLIRAMAIGAVVDGDIR